MAGGGGIGLRHLGALSTCALLVTAAASLAPAATLDDQTCDQLKREIVQLEGLGARDNLQKGAQWGRSNLNSAKLEQVKKLIEMDEAVAFRCPRPKPQPDPKQAKGPVKAVKSAAKAPGAESGRTAQDIVKPKPNPRPKAQAAVDGPKGDLAKAAPPAAQPKPKPRPPTPKPSDAYSPPKAPPAQ